MQQPGEKIRHSKRGRWKQSIKSPHISSFGILNRNGLEIPAGIDRPVIEDDSKTKQPAFTDGSMPEQPSGYIKCKKHDFL
jgi:hypothetical protein